MPGLSRRGLLRAGLLGSAAVWAAGLPGCRARERAGAADGAQRAALSPRGEEILRAVIPVVMGSLCDRTPACAQAIEAGLASLDDYLATLSLPLQEEAANVFRLLDLLPLRLLLLRTSQRWREAPPEQIEAFLNAARDSRLLLLRRIYVFLQSMAELAFFDQPFAWQKIGYPGPPLGPFAGAGAPA